MVVISDKALRKLFKELNVQFFDNPELQNYEICFAKLPDDDGQLIGDRIEISDRLRRSGDLLTIVLLHEMVHADLGAEYKGYPKDGYHGMRFQARIWELVKAGAYDGLL